MGRVMCMEMCLRQSREYPTTPNPRSENALPRCNGSCDVDGQGILPIPGMPHDTKAVAAFLLMQGKRLTEIAMGRVMCMETCLRLSREYPMTRNPRSENALPRCNGLCDVDGQGILPIPGMPHDTKAVAAFLLIQGKRLTEIAMGRVMCMETCLRQSREYPTIS
ncbi:uncharacterized protein LOC121387974 [Gigantopelta aegis]|uniref:uncharacterized protein LOC121387974 n=1 Tax=Gigantopelta aegis TaxID=1735272 RepID=UPI001B88CD50|nr:uncharacterized protein LOC121387974 [Gigantopelta aegis]